MKIRALVPFSTGTITMEKYEIREVSDAVGAKLVAAKLATEISGGGERFIVTLTPTAEDFSGTMDKTPEEITAAHEAGQEIVFNVVGFPGFDNVHIPAAWYTYATGHTRYAACATLVDIIHDLQIIVITTDIPDESYYVTKIYPLTPVN